MRPGGGARRTGLGSRGRDGRSGERLRRAFNEVLTVPLLIVLAFVALAVVVDRADNAAGAVAGWGPVRRFLGPSAGATQRPSWS